MPEPISIHIENAAKIQFVYAKAPALMTKALSLAVRKAVFLVARKSMINTPVKTGRLRGSTYSRFMPLSGVIGTKTNYDRFVHDGTRFMKGRPYLKMAVDDANPKINEFFTDATQSVLNEIGRQT